MTAAQNEELRHAALETLATRSGTALTADGIRRRIVAARTLDFSVPEDDVTTALQFLAGKGLVVSEHDPLGSTVYWRATSDGVLHYERAMI